MSSHPSGRKTGRGLYQDYTNNVNNNIHNEFASESPSPPSAQPPNLINSAEYYSGGNNRSGTFDIANNFPHVNKQSGYLQNKTQSSLALFPNGGDMSDSYASDPYRTLNEMRRNESSAFSEMEDWHASSHAPVHSTAAINMLRPPRYKHTEKFVDDMNTSSYADGIQKPHHVNPLHAPSHDGFDSSLDEEFIKTLLNPTHVSTNTRLDNSRESQMPSATFQQQHPPRASYSKLGNTQITALQVTRTEAEWIAARSNSEFDYSSAAASLRKKLGPVLVELQGTRGHHSHKRELSDQFMEPDRGDLQNRHFNGARQYPQRPKEVHHQAAGRDGRQSQMSYPESSRASRPDYRDHILSPEYSVKRHKTEVNENISSFFKKSEPHPSYFDTTIENLVNRQSTDYGTLARSEPPDAYYRSHLQTNFRQPQLGNPSGLFSSPYKRDSTRFAAHGTSADRLDAVKQDTSSHTSQRTSNHQHRPQHPDSFMDEVDPALVGSNKNYSPYVPYRLPKTPDTTVLDSVPPGYFDESPKTSNWLTASPLFGNRN
jgi:hypothetical protein